MLQSKGLNCLLEPRKPQAMNSRRNGRRIHKVAMQYLRNSWYFLWHVTEISDACWILKNEKGSSSVMHNRSIMTSLRQGHIDAKGRASGSPP